LARACANACAKDVSNQRSLLLQMAEEFVEFGLHALAQPGHQARHPRGQRQLALARECPWELGMTRALQEVIRVQILGKRSAET
jgi:hypothetical protein